MGQFETPVVTCPNGNVLYAGVDCTGVVMSDTDFELVGITGAILDDSTLTNVTVSYSDLHGVSFKGARFFERVGLYESNAAEMNLEGLKTFDTLELDGVDGSSMSMKKVFISNPAAHLTITNSDLSGSDLHGLTVAGNVSFENVSLAFADCGKFQANPDKDETQPHATSIITSLLYGTSFAEAYLRGGVLFGNEITETDFNEAVFENTKFSSGFCKDCEFEETTFDENSEILRMDFEQSSFFNTKMLGGTTLSLFRKTEVPKELEPEDYTIDFSQSGRMTEAYFLDGKLKLNCKRTALYVVWFLPDIEWLGETTFESASLTNVSLVGAFGQFKFSRASLVFVTLSGAYLEKGSEAEDASFNGVSLFESSWYHRTSFARSQIRFFDAIGMSAPRANFAGVTLESGLCKRCKFPFADFSKAELSGVDWEGANLTGTTWTDAQFGDDLNWVNAILMGAELPDGQLCEQFCPSRGCLCVQPEDTSQASPSPSPTSPTRTPIPSIFPGPSEAPTASPTPTANEDSGADEEGDPTTSPSPTAATQLTATPTPEPDGESVDCFPGEVTVELEDGSHVRMDELSTGQKVRVGEDEYSEVFFWGHKDPTARARSFVRIELESGRVLIVSPRHLVYANRKLVPSDAVGINDLMLDVEAGDVRVVSVSRDFISCGLYNPHTMHGDVVVNGVVSSSYTAVTYPRLAHALLGVERIAYRLGSSVLGSSLEVNRPRFLTWILRVGNSA
eukprot:CAMPEP_0185845966 /NCGR_PEP_ID=MMETSP1354-20130828/1783_1 /TAXON_ID=708628 /ORGANISM="Erythrolobus madagascarensis, Strain CCMP3276" /LENGTH=733 /DNA_ID=CAMNT_0028546047 /DNA_START=44 /DNA_END=2245 /DNA_ORIENTATION=-